MAPQPAVTPKILSKEQLLHARKVAKLHNETVVQCHGCFDIVHPGHVRHLRFAKQQGQRLLVSITHDQGVNKGDNRPLFPEHLRAENLAALDFVDWVYINPEDTAVSLLSEVEPDLYMKGREYESNKDPRFAAERAAVEGAGGRVVFSSGDVVFSSSALVQSLASHSPFDPEHPVAQDAAALKQLQTQFDLRPQTLTGFLNRSASKPIAIVGEPILDTYVHCDRPEIASDAPTIALRPVEEQTFDGGAAVIARHIAAAGGHPILITALPETDAAHSLQQRLRAEGVEVRTVKANTCLPRKERYLVGKDKVFKVDRVTHAPLDANQSDGLLGLIHETTQETEAAIIADFGISLFTPNTLELACKTARRNVNFLSGDVSSRRASLLAMREFDLLTPAEQELRGSVNDFDRSLNATVLEVLESTDAANIIVSLAEAGLVSFTKRPGADVDESWSSKLDAQPIPALNKNPVDTLGCGDSLLAITTLAATAGASIPQAAYLGSVAAALHAARLGNPSCDRSQLNRAITQLAKQDIVLTQGVA